MKKYLLLILILAIVTIALSACVPEKPVKDGRGELAVTIDREFTAPVTHSPLEWWQTRHFQVIDSGDMAEKDCLYCHQAERSCNNCHGYVGVRKIK
ncbi:hypothetical protein ANRL1_02623 [Anaerolineae bacterium]|nr:hypothetical protein ANRL1_02623 [Anaerolineae bacterium]